MDADLKAALAALADGQARTDASLRELSGEMRQLAVAQRHTDEALRGLTDRVDRMAELMIRGFDKVHRRQTDTDRRLDEFEARLDEG